MLKHLRRKSRTYVSRRFWILAGLFVALCALAVVQYSWVNRLAKAERRRAQANLAAALANVQSDADVEITRAFMLFQLPSDGPADYARRYEEWVRRAPYPNVIRGVYIADAARKDHAPKAVVPGEPAITLGEWKRALAKPGLPLSGVAVGDARKFVPEPKAVANAGGGVAVSFESFRHEVEVDGNPAFVIPIIPILRGDTARVVIRAPGIASRFQQNQIVGVGGPVHPSQWVVVVLNAAYIGKSLLPKLLRLYFPAPVYEVQVVSRNTGTPPRVIFASEPAARAAGFTHPDGKIDLFQLRPDCFSATPPPNTIRVGGTVPDVALFSTDSKAGILARRLTTCDSPAPAKGNASDGLWELLVRYRAGSLDQAMAAFRDRNLLLGGSVLVVLALGISMLVVLTERARALAEMQAEFALGVSHELRTPLTVIRLAADNLKRGMVKDSEQARKYGDIIHAHATELSNMIEETLEFARIHSPTLLRQRTIVFPDQVVKEVLADSEGTLRDAGIEFELDLAPDLPPVSADADLLKRCLENLIQNAVKHAAAGRWMAIRVCRAIRPEGERVEISVEDRGPGISPADVPHIFEPFYRGKQDEATQAPGVGLGLALVKRVVEAHHGAVEVETSKTTGTRFSILLPPHRPRPEPPAVE